MKKSNICLSIKNVVVVTQIAFSSYAVAGEVTFLETGNRLLVKTEGRDDYKPRIVECTASKIGICLRDTRGTPPDNPIEEADNGNLRVTFATWGITYIISPDGTGVTLNADGKALSPFAWELVPE